MRFIFLLLSLVSIESVFGQVTFNRRYDLGSPNVVMGDVYVTDSLYYITGIITAPHNTAIGANLFARVDLNGDVQSYNFLDTLQINTETWEQTMIYQDSSFFTVGYEIGAGCMKAIMIQYNEWGDTIKVRRYLNPYDSCNFIRPTGLYLESDGSFLIASAVDVVHVISDPYLIKAKSNGDTLWTFAPEYGGFKHYSSKVLKYPNQDTYLFGHLKSDNQYTQSLYIMRHEWHKLDTNGNELLRKETPGAWELLPLKLGQIRDVRWTNDGGLIVASAWGWEVQGTSSNSMRYDPFIYKLDSNLDWVWGKRLGGDDLSYDITHINKIIESEDSSLLAFGTAPYYSDTDSNTAFHYGVMFKLSAQGDSLWNRKYYYIPTHFSKNIIYDAEQTYDGGYIMCGEVTGNDPNNPNAAIQQGWLLKVDSFGCLVPGCHLTSSQEEIELKAWRMDIYPNPTTDFINVYLGIETPDNATLSVINLQGQVMEETHVHADATYIFSVVDYPVGVYFLHLVSPEGALLGTQKVIVGR